MDRCHILVIFIHVLAHNQWWDEAFKAWEVFETDIYFITFQPRTNRYARKNSQGGQSSIYSPAPEYDDPANYAPEVSKSTNLFILRLQLSKYIYKTSNI